MPHSSWHVTALGFEMPLTEKGGKIKRRMTKTYGKKGESVFHASINKGKVKNAERKKKRRT